MAMLRDLMPALCYDEAFNDVGSQTGWEEGRVGSHPWELPMAGRSCTFAQDYGGWPANMAGISSSSPSSSSVVTFNSHGEEYFASNNFSFGGDSGGGDVMAAAGSQKRSRARAPPQGAEEEAAAPPPKKQCGGNRRAATKHNKAPTATAPKDPQNLAAKNRRERISERLKALQELVPNGSKVNTVTMLDKAITYVRFMQLQLKVLEMDAFWLAPAGEAPKMSQVKEAVAAILLSPPFL